MSKAVADHIAEGQAEAILSKVVIAIAATPVGVVVTLNYDTLIEEAARTRGREAYALHLRTSPS